LKEGEISWTDIGVRVVVRVVRVEKVAKAKEGNRDE